MLNALHTLFFAEPYWLHDSAIGMGGILWLYWGWRQGRTWPLWQQVAYVAGAALLAHYETAAGMAWYWGAAGFGLLLLALSASRRRPLDGVSGDARQP